MKIESVHYRGNLHFLTKICPYVKASINYNIFLKGTGNKYTHDIFVGSKDCSSCINFVAFDEEKFEIICKADDLEKIEEKK